MSTPDSAAAGSRWSTRRWLVVGLVVVLLAVWLALRFAFFVERESQFFGTLRASLDKTVEELQRQAVLPAEQRRVEQLQTVVGLDITSVRGAELLRIEVPAANLDGATQYAVVTATSSTPDIPAVLGVEARYAEVLVSVTATGSSSDQSVCVVRVDSPSKDRTTEDLEWGTALVVPPCTDEQLAAAGGIAR